MFEKWLTPAPRIKSVNWLYLALPNVSLLICEMYQSSDNKLILQQSNQAWAFYDKEGKFYDKAS